MKIEKQTKKVYLHTSEVISIETLKIQIVKNEYRKVVKLLLKQRQCFRYNNKNYYVNIDNFEKLLIDVNLNKPNRIIFEAIEISPDMEMDLPSFYLEELQ